MLVFNNFNLSSILITCITNVPTVEFSKSLSTHTTQTYVQAATVLSVFVLKYQSIFSLILCIASRFIKKVTLTITFGRKIEGLYVKKSQQKKQCFGNCIAWISLMCLMVWTWPLMNSMRVSDLQRQRSSNDSPGNLIRMTIATEMGLWN